MTSKIYDPEFATSTDVLEQFADFVSIVKQLRRDCPWDREQSHESIKHLLIEEAYETVEAIDDGDQKELKKELGDILFTCVNLARHTGVDAELALRRAASRFESRFNDMEQWADKSQRSLADMSEVELDSLWNRAKGQA
jgi:uncharacterized protein YabN with tetrapyrrole methylase and pyrophosphatase domain